MYDIQIYIKFIDNKHFQKINLLDLTVILLDFYVYTCNEKLANLHMY